MQDKKKFPEQQESNSNQRNAGKNETLSDPGADVVDYGCSNQQAMKNAKDHNDRSKERQGNEEKK